MIKFKTDCQLKIQIIILIYFSMIPFSKLDKKQNLTGLQLKEYF
jgi:hypothetical protein